MSKPVFKSAIQKAVEASRKVVSNAITQPPISPQSAANLPAEIKPEPAPKGGARPAIHGFVIDGAPFYMPSRWKKRSQGGDAGKEEDFDVAAGETTKSTSSETECQDQSREQEKDEIENEHLTREGKTGDTGTGGTG